MYWWDPIELMESLGLEEGAYITGYDCLPNGMAVCSWFKEGEPQGIAGFGAYE